MTLKLYNNVSKKEYEFSVNDEEDSKIFYHFTDFVLAEDMDNGEYNYYLYDNDNNLVAQGLLQIGEYVQSHTTYTEQNKTSYVQYNG